MTSEAQRTANQHNAKRSTGPRTREGKTISAQNSITHGGYATGAAPIPRGPFIEDPAEVQGFVDRIVAALDPRDDLEAQEARNVAVNYLRLERVSRLEAEAMAGAAPAPKTLDLMIDPDADTSEQARREEAALRVLDRILSVSSRIEARSSGSLDRSLARYRDLKQRDIESRP